MNQGYRYPIYPESRASAQAGVDNASFYSTSLVGGPFGASPDGLGRVTAISGLGEEAPVRSSSLTVSPMAVIFGGLLGASAGYLLAAGTGQSRAKYAKYGAAGMAIYSGVLKKPQGMEGLGLTAGAMLLFGLAGIVALTSSGKKA